VLIETEVAQYILVSAIEPANGTSEAAVNDFYDQARAQKSFNFLNTE
jgi:hypothetical protein